MARRLVLLVLAAFGILVIAMFTRFISTMTPDQVMVSLFDMNIPTRYAFVSDRYQAKVAVIDLYQNQQVATLPLKIRPEFWSLSASLGQLIYAGKGSSKIYLYDIKRHYSNHIAVQHPITHWHYNDEQHWLFIEGDDFLSRVNVVTGDIDTIKLESSTDISGLIYDAFRQDLWISDSASHQWQVWHVSDNPAGRGVDKLTSVESSEQPTPFIVTPNGAYLVQGFSDNLESYVTLLDLDDVVSSPTTIKVTTADLVRPYAGARGRYLWVFAKNGQGIRVDLTDTQQVQKIKSSQEKVELIATGWLDSRLLIAGDTIAIYDADSLEPLIQHPLPASIRDIFITADSKTALLTTGQAARLYSLSIRDGRMTAIDLPNEFFPEQVIMGASATLCH